VLALIYDLVEDYLERRGPLREDHLALAHAAQQRGDLVLAGAFSDPADAALLVWRGDDRSVVEAFVESDPYVANGLVQGWQIRAWNVVVGQDGS
jgi:hypothetical protein